MPSTDYSYSRSTSSSLIDRAKSGDSIAWTSLAQLYGPLVYSWARRKGLQQSDAADVMQDVFRNVARSLQTFHKTRPEDSFRAWLRSITENELRRFFQRKGRLPHTLEEADKYPWQILEDPTTDASADTSAQFHILRQAIEIVRRDTQQRTWNAFWRVTVLEQSAADVGGDLGMTEKAVRQAKYRVLCRLRELLRDG